MKNSKLFTINTKDLFKGIFLAVITSVLTALLQMLTALPPSIDFKAIGVVAITTIIGYLIKQFSSNSNGMPLTKESNLVGTRPDDR